MIFSISSLGNRYNVILGNRIPLSQRDSDLQNYLREFHAIYNVSTTSDQNNNNQDITKCEEYLNTHSYSNCLTPFQILLDNKDNNQQLKSCLRLERNKITELQGKLRNQYTTSINNIETDLGIVDTKLAKLYNNHKDNQAPYLGVEVENCLLIEVENY